VKAAKEVGLKVPMVVRLQGTNMEEGRRILAESGLEFYSAETMKEAAEKVVSLVKGVSQ
ncbi:MAG: succinate--CoA ligase subunit beta, partial [Candidatus Aminicenantes bacterium]|nr:succinate--CoA ligase subunit beta [Candidatus Aminicenantes bacterium]